MKRLYLLLLFLSALAFQANGQIELDNRSMIGVTSSGDTLYFTKFIVFDEGLQSRKTIILTTAIETALKVFKTIGKDSLKIGWGFSPLNFDAAGTRLISAKRNGTEFFSVDTLASNGMTLRTSTTNASILTSSSLGIYAPAGTDTGLVINFDKNATKDSLFYVFPGSLRSGVATFNTSGELQIRTTNPSITFWPNNTYTFFVSTSEFQPGIGGDIVSMGSYLKPFKKYFGTDSLLIGGKSQSATIAVTGNNSMGIGDSALVMTIVSGVPTLSGRATNSNESNFTWNTSDQVVLTGGDLVIATGEKILNGAVQWTAAASDSFNADILSKLSTPALLSVKIGNSVSETITQVDTVKTPGGVVRWVKITINGSVFWASADTNTVK